MRSARYEEEDNKICLATHIKNEAVVKTTVEETKYVKENKVDKLQIAGKRPQRVPQSSPNSKMPQSSEAMPEVQPVSVQGRSESKTDRLKNSWRSGKHMQTIGEKRTHPPPKCAPGFDPRSVELPPPAPWHKEERKAADNVTRTPTNTFKRTDEVKYQKLSKAMARISKRRWRR